MEDQVAGRRQSGFGEEPMPGREGSPQGVPQTAPDDVETLRKDLESANARLKELQEARERDISNLKSTFDQRYHSEIAERESRIQDMESRMHAAAMANMDEAERKDYRLQIAEERNQRLSEALDQERWRAQAGAQVGKYATDFLQMGVPYDQLNFDGPQEMWQSGWDALKKLREQERSELERFRSNQPQDESLDQAQAPAPNAPRRTPVVTQHGQQMSGPNTMSDVIKSLEAQYGQEFDEEKVFTWIERRYLPPELLENIDWSK